LTTHQDTSGFERKVFSLFELTKSIESVIGKAYQRSYWIRAEIAKLNFYPKSGHCYPDLVEKENGHTMAQIRATIWAGPFQSISRKFLEVTREPLSDGMKVLFLASVNFHPTHGLTLQISDIDPSFSLGEMARERNESIAKLKKEGLFDLNRGLPFPVLPQRIAIISVETSKGFHDFMQTIANNEGGFQLFTMLFPALLQGAGAITSIRQQLARIKKVIHHFDVVIIIRGGGGDVGLSSFDHYTLASAVASFSLPVITGIGHATNQTVVELVAHSNKITPTEVAYFLLERFQLFAERVDEAETYIMNFAENFLTQHNQELGLLADRMNSRTLSLMAGHHYRLNRSGLLLERELKSRAHQQKLHLKQLSDWLNGASRQLFARDRIAIQSFGQHLEKELPRFLSSATRQVELLEQKNQLLDPVNVLKRGFSITTRQGKSVRDAAQLKAGEEIETRLYNGKTVSVIKKIES
jgi:exodeoxyribonuclease VII large subunit